MSNYFDNQTSWSWNNSDGKSTVTTLHDHPKPHSHTLDLTDISIGELVDNTGKVMGEAHRASTHDYTTSSGKESGKVAEKTAFLQSLRADQSTIERTNEVGRSFAEKSSAAKAKADTGGRERGDAGPGKLGREPGLKTGSHVAAIRADVSSSAKATAPSQGKSGQASAQANSSSHGGSGKSSAGGKTGAVATGVSTGGKAGVSGSSVSGGKGAASGGGHGSSGGGSGGFGGGHGSSGGGGSGGGSGGGHGGHGGH